METSTRRIELALYKFYIFNATFCKREGDEDRKILYYYPKYINLNTQIKDVGLAEAIIMFTGNFNDDNGSCRSLHTQKTTQIFYQPERDFWMVMVINVPKRVQSGATRAVYKGIEVHDRVYRAALKQCYIKFRLLSGTFEMNLEGAAGMELLQHRLAKFYDRLLLNLELSNYNILNALRSIQYLPLDKTLFLRARRFIDKIQITFPSIVDTILLYKTQIVCSKINTTDLYCIHAHLLRYVLSKTVPNYSIPRGHIMRANVIVVESYRTGGFVTGPPDWPNSRAAPIVYLMRDGKLQMFYLVIYRALNATLCLLLSSTKRTSDDFYRELHTYAGPRLTRIAVDMEETLKKPTATPVGITKRLLTCTLANDPLAPKYLFIDEKSLRHMSNIYLDKYRSDVDIIPINVMNLISDLNTNMHWDDADVNSDEQQEDKSAAVEVVMKTKNDFWIVKRRCNKCQFYVVISNSTATLLQIEQMTQNIIKQNITDHVLFNTCYCCFEILQSPATPKERSSIAWYSGFKRYFRRKDAM